MKKLSLWSLLLIGSTCANEQALDSPVVLNDKGPSMLTLDLH